MHWRVEASVRILEPLHAWHRLDSGSCFRLSAFFQLTVIRVHGPSVRPYVLAPGTPKARVELLRKAFADTMKDPEFLADVKKSKLDINPLSGEELHENIWEIFKLQPVLVERLKEILR